MRPTTARTMRWLRGEGGLAGKVEQWVRRGAPGEGQAPGVRRDLFGVADVVFVPSPGTTWSGRSTWYVQSCAAGGHAGHRAKILASSEAAAIVAAGNGVLLVSWAKRGPRGKRKLWTPRVEDLTFELTNREEAA